MYNITPSIFMTSYPKCILSLYCFHDYTTTIPSISPTIFDITATVSVSSHRSHTHLCWCIAVSITSQQVCKSSHLSHVWHHTQSTSHHIDTIWRQWSCFMSSQSQHSWHHVSSIWYHIHSLRHHTTLCMTSSPLYLTSRHCVCVITPTLSVTSQPLYGWYHIQYICHIISPIFRT